MGIFKLDSKQLFLRSAGKSRVMVVKLRKNNVDSNFVETKDWEVVEMIGTNMNYDSLQIFGHKVTGHDLTRLATNLTQSRLWVNMDGISFLRIGVTTSSLLLVLFNQTKDLFDWTQFGVKIPKSPKNNDDKEKEDFGEKIKKLEGKVEELRNDINNKDEEIARLNKLISSSSSSSSYDNQNNNILNYNRIYYLNYSLYYSPDLSGTTIYYPDGGFADRFPSGIIDIYVSEGFFDEDHWWFFKVKDESQSNEFMFAFYNGSYDMTTTYNGNDLLKIPYTSSAILRSNVSFKAVLLQGKGTVFGFSY